MRKTRNRMSIFFQNFASMGGSLQKSFSYFVCPNVKLVIISVKSVNNIFIFYFVCLLFSRRSEIATSVPSLAG